MAASISMGTELSLSSPVLLFEEPYVMRSFQIRELLNYDVARDGKRFVMLQPVEGESAPPTELHVVLNWFEELKRRVPTN